MLTFSPRLDLTLSVNMSTNDKILCYCNKHVLLEGNQRSSIFHCTAFICWQLVLSYSVKVSYAFLVFGFGVWDEYWSSIAIVGDITPSDGVPKEEKSRREQAVLNEMCEVLGGGMRGTLSYLYLGLLIC